MPRRSWEDLQELVLAHPEISATAHGSRRERLKYITQHVTELWREVEINNQDGVKYNLGSLLIECILQAEMSHTTVQDCLDYAYKTIKQFDQST